MKIRSSRLTVRAPHLDATEFMLQGFARTNCRKSTLFGQAFCKNLCADDMLAVGPQGGRNSHNRSGQICWNSSIGHWAEDSLARSWTSLGHSKLGNYSYKFTAMSLGDDDDQYWNSSGSKAFSFDDEDQQHNQQQLNQHQQQHQSQQSSSQIKTLGSVLAAKTLSDEPFLRPSIIPCHGRNKVNLLIDYLDKNTPSVQTKPPKQDPKTYISDIVHNGAKIDFSPYKSKRDKLLLLDCAICCNDGNTITAVTIFLSKTLKQSIFVEEIIKRPSALNHHLNYLEMTDRDREILELKHAIQK